MVIGVFGYDQKTIPPGILPDRPISRSSQADIPHMSRTREGFGQHADETRRQILVEEKSGRLLSRP
jgi:hypothetical protein